MESSVRQHLVSIVVRILHAHHFTRCSAVASAVLTDVVERYLELLALTAAQHAHHSGRSIPNILDAVAALTELGVTAEDLLQYGLGPEASDVAKYHLMTQPDPPAAGPSKAAVAAATAHQATSTSVSRRLDALADLRVSLHDGITPHEDVIPLHYAPLSSVSSPKGKERETIGQMDEPAFSEVIAQPHSPRLPMSPVSNPAYSPPSSPRLSKRPRPIDWSPPPHIPQFLPPFPHLTNMDQPPITQPAPESTSPRKQRAPLLPANKANAKPCYTKPSPFPSSSLSPSWDPPSSLPSEDLKPALPNSSSLSALISAYNVLQTEMKPQPATNPSRLLVARSLSLTVNPAPRDRVQEGYAFQSSSSTSLQNSTSLGFSLQKYDVLDTLFASASTQSAQLRHLPPYPSHPIPLDKESKLPIPGPWVFSKPTMTNSENDVIGSSPGLGPASQPPNLVTSQRPSQPSHPETVSLLSSEKGNLTRLAKELLSPTVYMRATRLLPPPPLVSNNAVPSQPQAPGEIATYNTPVAAPWNSSLNSFDGSEMPALLPKKKSEKEKLKKGGLNGVDNSLLADAKLYATWDWTVKGFNDNLPNFTARRGRIGSYSGFSQTSYSPQLVKPLPLPQTANTVTSSGMNRQSLGDSSPSLHQAASVLPTVHGSSDTLNPL